MKPTGMNQAGAKESIDEQVLRLLKENGSMSVPRLHEALKVVRTSLTESETTDLVWHLVDQGQVDVEDLPPPHGSFIEFLRMWDRNISLYLAICFTLVAALAIFILPTEFPLEVLRWTLGSIFVVFLPGYVAVQALFPLGWRDRIEELGLSFGLSLALVPIVGLVLNFTPWGIRLTSITISLTIVTLALALTAVGRRFDVSTRKLRATA